MVAKEKAVYAKAMKEKDDDGGGDEDAVARYARIHALQKQATSFNVRGAADQELSVSDPRARHVSGDHVI